MALDILIIDDEAGIRTILSDVLTDFGYHTRTAATEFDAMDLIYAREPNLIILDVWLGTGDQDGIHVLEKIKQKSPNVPIIMISGHATIEVAVLAIKNGAYDFIEKPFQTNRLIHMVARALESSALKRENENLKIKAGIGTPLIGTSGAITQLITQVEKAITTNSRVFISSPSGFDQEELAFHIHKNSSRSKYPFIKINIDSIGEQYVQSELFGIEIYNQEDNEKKIGALERAHMGTIFIENFSHLTPSMQSKFIKFLHEKQFFRVSGDHAIKVDVRIIAGTYDNMSEKIEHEQFREDLYYRMNVCSLTIPPLGERICDIEPLAEYYMEKLAKKHNMPNRKLNSDVIALFQAYTWPGDLKQLKNIIEYLIIMGDSNIKEPITKEKLPSEIRAGNVFLNHWQKKTADIIVLPLKKARDVFEKEYIAAQVKRFSGNISKTARFIGMERSALHRKMRTLGLTHPSKIG